MNSKDSMQLKKKETLLTMTDYLLITNSKKRPKLKNNSIDYANFGKKNSFLTQLLNYKRNDYQLINA